MTPLHVIDSKNIRMVVTQEQLDMLNDSSDDKCQVDMQWYQDNGYVPIEEAIKKLENMKSDNDLH